MTLIEAIRNSDPTQPNLGIYATDTTESAPAQYGDFTLHNGGIEDWRYVFICSAVCFQAWKESQLDSLGSSWFNEFMDWLEG